VLLLCVKTEACTEHLLVHFKQHAEIEFLTAKGISPIEILYGVQVVYGDGCVDVSIVSLGQKM
jgi:hypothetical protein